VTETARLIGLEGNSKIDIDWKENRYSVTVEGNEVAKDSDTFCPLGKDRIAFYSKTAPLPAGWNAQVVAALALFADRAETIPFAIQDGKIALAVPAHRPVMVFRDGPAARKQLQPVAGEQRAMR
jgi:hypothetical protein